MKNLRNKHFFEILFEFLKNPIEYFLPFLLFVMHSLYVIFIVYIIVFSYSTWHLFVVFCVLLVNIAANIWLFRSCPLALLEESLINTHCFRSFSLFFSKILHEKKKKKKQNKVLSKHLPYLVHESTTQNLLILYLLAVVKMLFLFIYKG